ncbi:MAG: class I SAM-dependent methyltransferase [Ilumatobacteraceae bacterium]
MELPDSWRTVALGTKGFMPADEGDALHAAALEAAAAVPDLPFVEVGSYCGRSTIWLAAAARTAGRVVFAVDHHRGSEENQRGWEHHDPDVVDGEVGLMDTLPFLRRALFDAGVEDWAIPVVGRSALVAAHWTTPASFVFIDGGHGAEPARRLRRVVAARRSRRHAGDSRRLPRSGRRRSPPYEEVYLPALSAGFVERSVTGGLRVLTRA